LYATPLLSSPLLSSPLIFLAKIDLIDVLPQIHENLRIPLGVYQEIKGQNDAAGEWVE